MSGRPGRALLFDWGDTLMRVFPEYAGKMATWPRVEALPGAIEALAALQAGWLLGAATNAAESEAADIRAALKRAGLAAYFKRIYCFRTLGFKKPAAEFFNAIAQDLAWPPASLVMVGDDFRADVLGATAQGWRAVWLNPTTGEDCRGDLYRTIHHLSDLPGLLAGWPSSLA